MLWTFRNFVEEEQKYVLSLIIIIVNIKETKFQLCNISTLFVYAVGALIINILLLLIAIKVSIGQDKVNGIGFQSLGAQNAGRLITVQSSGIATLTPTL